MQPTTNKSASRLLIFLILVLLASFFIAWISEPGFVWPKWLGFGEYTTTSTSKSVETDPIASQTTVTEITTTEIHSGKTFWDWLELLIVPFALGVFALWFNRQTKEREHNLNEIRRKAEEKSALNKYQENILQSYLDKMTKLMLDQKLVENKSTIDNPVRKVAQIQTITTLRLLDRGRKNIIFQFLRDSDLADSLLENASLMDADLNGINMDFINFHDSDLTRAKLNGCNLNGCNFSDSRLWYALINNSSFADLTIRRRQRR